MLLAVQFTTRLATVFGLLSACVSASAAETHRSAPIEAAFWPIPQEIFDDYPAKCLVFTLQGLANREAPRVFFDTSNLDFDFPESDTVWKKYLETTRVAFQPIDGGVCGLVRALDVAGIFGGVVAYPDDGFSVFPALTIAGLRDLLPITSAHADKYPCLARLPVRADLRPFAFTDKMAAHEWAVEHLLPNCSRSVVFNANMGPNAVSVQSDSTILSVDHPIAQRAFIMDLCPLWKCDPLDCKPPSTRHGTPEETALYIKILGELDELVSVWGWSDPEHAFTNITSHAGGVVFCTFSSPNLSFWAALGLARGTAPLPLPSPDRGMELDEDKYYIVFETNEGDTPRILTSQVIAHVPPRASRRDCALVIVRSSPRHGSRPIAAKCPSRGPSTHCSARCSPNYGMRS